MVNVLHMVFILTDHEIAKTSLLDDQDIGRLASLFVKVERTFRKIRNGSVVKVSKCIYFFGTCV
jgi:hypothetical protein